MPAPTILGATYKGYQSGWQILFDYQYGLSSSNRRVRLLQGPAKSIDYQIAILEDTYACEFIDPSVSPGSAVATIRLIYKTVTEALPAGEHRYPVYAISPMMISIDLKGHPALDAITPDLPAIDLLISQGNIAQIAADYAASAIALQYARLVIAGVTSYEQPGMQLSITRYYQNSPSLSADYQQIGEVFAWADIKTDHKQIPASVDEPKYLLPTGDAQGYEWRLQSVAPVLSRREDNVVSWTYLGLQRWAAWLYRGGTWEPAALS